MCYGLVIEQPLAWATVIGVYLLTVLWIRITNIGMGLNYSGCKFRQTGVGLSVKYMVTDSFHDGDDDDDDDGYD